MWGLFNMVKLIIPKRMSEIKIPLIFLAGPIRGAPNWQDEAVKIINEIDPEMYIVSPRRGIRTSIAPYVLHGDETLFERQRAWERYHLEIAKYDGAIMFWLPGEIEHDCKKSYGAMTRMELGLVIAWYKQNLRSIKWCIGSDGKFSELDTIQYDLKIDAPDKKIFPTLEETCAEAVRIARS